MKRIWLSGILLCLSTPAFAADTATSPASSVPVPAPVPAAPVPAAAAPAIAAPDPENQINSALGEYKQQHYGKAANALDAAAHQLRKMKSAALAKFLPAAPQGWTSKEESGAVALLTTMVNGSAAERIYQSGDETIKLTISTDSKMLGALHKLASSISTTPMKFIGYDYAYKTADPAKPYEKDNEATLYISEAFVISVTGPKLTDQQAQGFLGLIDLPKLKVEAEK